MIQHIFFICKCTRNLWKNTICGHKYIIRPIIPSALGLFKKKYHHIGHQMPVGRMSDYWFYDAVDHNDLDLVRDMVRGGKWDLFKPFPIVRKEIWRGNCPIHLASYNGHLDMLMYMLAEGVPVNVRTDYAQRTPLHFCCMDRQEQNDMQCATLLLRQGADIDVRDR